MHCRTTHTHTHSPAHTKPTTHTNPPWFGIWPEGAGPSPELVTLSLARRAATAAVALPCCCSAALEWVGVTPRGEPLLSALAAASAMLPRIWGHWPRGLEGPPGGLMMSSLQGWAAEQWQCSTAAGLRSFAGLSGQLQSAQAPARTQHGKKKTASQPAAHVCRSVKLVSDPCASSSTPEEAPRRPPAPPTPAGRYTAAAEMEEG